MSAGVAEENTLLMLEGIGVLSGRGRLRDCVPENVELASAFDGSCVPVLDMLVQEEGKESE